MILQQEMWNLQRHPLPLVPSIAFVPQEKRSSVSSAFPIWNWRTPHGQTADLLETCQFGVLWKNFGISLRSAAWLRDVEGTFCKTHVFIAHIRGSCQGSGISNDSERIKHDQTISNNIGSTKEHLENSRRYLHKPYIIHIYIIYVWLILSFLSPV